MRRNRDDYCLACLRRVDQVLLQEYVVKNEVMKAIFQMENVILCYICKRMAKHFSTFIQNVQSNQIFLDNIKKLSKRSLQSAQMETKPIIKLSTEKLEILHLSPDSEFKDFITYGCGTKKSIKEEPQVKLDEDGEFNYLDNSNMDAADSTTDFPEKVEVKEDDEVLDSYDPLNDLLNESNELNESIIKKEDWNNANTADANDADYIERLKLTKQQCIAERNRKKIDPKYLESKFKCEFCIKGFTFKSSYNRHMERHSESYGEFECDVCKLRMDTKSKLSYHKEYHENRFRCKICNIKRVWRRSIKEHYMVTHSPSTYAFQCPHCPKMFGREYSYKKHLKNVHSKKQRVICHYCDKSYACKDVLRAHLINKHKEIDSSYTVGTRYSCSECAAAFTCRSKLKMHSIKHSSKRDYYCVECDKSYKTEQVFKTHLKTASTHVNNAELPLPCRFCDKRFAVKRDVERHENRVHLNIKPFKCDKCDKAYINSWSLRYHTMFRHEGRKRPMKYPCTMCDKVFDRNQILKSHMRTHTGERPFACSECSGRFAQANVLRTHTRLVHLNQTRDGRPKRNK